MTHDDAVHLLPLLAANELDDDLRVTTGQHVADCADCARELAAMRGALALLHDALLGGDDVATPGSEVAALSPVALTEAPPPQPTPKRQAADPAKRAARRARKAGKPGDAAVVPFPVPKRRVNKQERNRRRYWRNVAAVLVAMFILAGVFFAFPQRDHIDMLGGERPPGYLTQLARRFSPFDKPEVARTQTARIIEPVTRHTVADEEVPLLQEDSDFAEQVAAPTPTTTSPAPESRESAQRMTVAKPADSDTARTNSASRVQHITNSLAKARSTGNGGDIGASNEVGSGMGSGGRLVDDVVLTSETESGWVPFAAPTPVKAPPTPEPLQIDRLYSARTTTGRKPSEIRGLPDYRRGDDSTLNGATDKPSSDTTTDNKAGAEQQAQDMRVQLAYDKAPAANQPDNQWMNGLFIDGHAEGTRQDATKKWKSNDDKEIDESKSAWRSGADASAFATMPVDSGTFEIPPSPALIPATPVFGNDSSMPDTADDDADVKQKLRDIRLPKIKFDDAPSADVFRYLTERSAQLDHTDGTGVSILYVNPDGSRTATPPASLTAAKPGAASAGNGFDDIDFATIADGDTFSAADTAPHASVDGPSIVTMEFDDIPLGDAIRYATQAADPPLRYKVENNTVVIYPEDMVIDPLETRFYSVPPGVFFSGTTRSAGDDDDDDDDGATKATDITHMLADYGVHFPPTTSVVYNARSSKLVVTNTPDELHKVERILDEIVNSPSCHAVTAPSDLDQARRFNDLGLDWSYTGRETKTSKNVPGLLGALTTPVGINPQEVREAALAQEKVGNTGNALKLYSILAKAAPDASFMPDVYLRRAAIHAARDDEDDAQSLYQEILAKWPASEAAKTAHLHLAASNAAPDQPDAAVSTPTPIPAPKSHIPANAARTLHTVNGYETLADIAAMYGVEPAWIVESTPELGVPGATLKPGMRLIVPVLPAANVFAKAPEGDTLPPAPKRPAPPVNPFELTAQDAQSTFALEADTAGYTLSRRYIRQGYKPPPAVVRMEEMINAFDYNYPTQAANTFNIYSSAAPSPFRPNLTLLKIGVKARVVGRDGRKPSHLVFAIDASGSMGTPDRLPLVKHALTLLIGQLDASDRVSIVTFGTGTTLVREAESAAERAELIQAIQRIEPGASTNLQEGIKLAYSVATRNFHAGEINRIILCSDGVANVGPEDAKSILAMVDKQRRNGITFTSVGVGADTYDDAMLEQLANRGDGNYVYLDSPEQARRVFVDEFSSTLQTVAKDARIQVVFDPRRVRRYRLIGYENRAIADADFRNDSVDAGEINSGQAATALYELEMQPLAEGDVPGDFGTVFVRYQNMDTEQVEEISSRLTAETIQPRTAASDPYFFLAASAGEFAEQLRGSEYAARTTLRDVQHLLLQVTQALPANPQAQELLKLTQQADGLPTFK